MGCINHNVIIATTWNKEVADAFEKWYSNENEMWDTEKVKKLFCRTDCLKINGFITFFFGPDGSKEGWKESEDSDIMRRIIIERFVLDNYSDGGSPWAWIEVGYGEFGQKVLQGNNINCYTNEEYCSNDIL